jgi:hypothetical protein
MEPNSKKYLTGYAWLAGSICILLGLYFLAVGLGIIDYDPLTIYIPMWMVVCWGIVWFLGGVIVISQHALNKSSSLIIADFFGPYFLGTITLTFGWIAFGGLNETQSSSASNNIFSKIITSINTEPTITMVFLLLLVIFIYSTIHTVKKYAKKFS